MNTHAWSKGWLLVAAVLLAVLVGVFLPWGGDVDLGLIAVRASAGVIYVDASASASEPDGLSWATAFT
ncbi:MAG: hypothetical protein ACK2UI_16420, partial [Anaerolineae bacterium]